jgi:hypothetical protein
MTQRIKQFYEQCNRVVDDPFSGAHISFDYQMFAELIVKECVSMSDELKAQYLTSRKSTMDFDEKNIYAEGEAACDILRYKMKKHFGVEE